MKFVRFQLEPPLVPQILGKPILHADVLETECFQISFNNEVRNPGLEGLGLEAKKDSGSLSL